MVDGKKMMNICILEILRKYTDSEHTMDQKDIIKKLETEYGMKVDRKSVKSKDRKSTRLNSSHIL